jgi:hypothetical protein
VSNTILEQTPEGTAIVWIIGVSQDPCVKDLAPSMALLGRDGTVKGWILVGGLQVIDRHVFEGGLGILTPSFLSCWLLGHG